MQFGGTDPHFFLPQQALQKPTPHTIRQSIRPNLLNRLNSFVNVKEIKGKRRFSRVLILVTIQRTEVRHGSNRMARTVRYMRFWF